MGKALVMDREAFFAWAEAQEERFERIEGEAMMMSPECVGHVRVKSQVWRVLEDALAGRTGFEVLGDGVAVSVDPDTDYQPDVVVNAGAELPPGTYVASNPLVVIEVLSPSTQRIDSFIKRDRYLSLPSVRHYLLFRADRRLVTHWRRDGSLTPDEWTGGAVPLDPPGILLDLDLIYTRAKVP